MKMLIVLISFVLIGNSSSQEEAIIKEKLQNQAKCWNHGDIECFMADYWQSEELLFIGKSGVTYGWENTLNNYKNRYPTRKEMGLLKFEILELNKLDHQHYFMVGKWNLEREVGDISGHFSLIWKKIDGDWVIIADHSS
jgi:hypothetical protein